MKNKEYISLEKQKRNINSEIKDNRSEISQLEKIIRTLKRKNSKLETKLADINGKQLKILNGGKEIPIFIGNSKGMF